MKVNDPSVLKIINRTIASERLNKIQILHIVKLVSVSNTIKELKDNMNWEKFKPNN